MERFHLPEDYELKESYVLVFLFQSLSITTLQMSIKILENETLVEFTK